MEQEINIEETGPDFLLDTLEHYLESAEFSDVILISKEGDQLPAHRAILSSVSGFLRQIFLQENLTDDPLQLHLPEVSTRDLYALLQLAYCGTIELNVQRKQSLISVLQLLLVSNDIVIAGDEGEDLKVNEIAIITSTDSMLGDKIAEEEEDGIPNIVVKNDDSGIPNIVVSRTLTTPVGSLSLSRVERPKPKVKNRLQPLKNVAVSSTIVPKAVTVEFKPKKRPGAPIATISATTQPAKMPALPSAPDFALSSQPLTAESSFGSLGMVASKEEADRITREVLDSANSEHGMNRRCERCQCPNCAAQLRAGVQGKGLSNLHVCHYATCGKKYKKTSHLRAHLRWHIGDQPFHCPWPECGKKFTRSDELHRHYRIHTGEKNHKCNVCQKCFSRSDHLKKHLLSHAAAGHTVPFNHQQIV